MTEANILSLTRDVMREVMQLAGYRVETVTGATGGTQLRSATNGLPFLLRFGNRLIGERESYADATLSAVLQLQAALPPHALNQWNGSKRFARLHLNGNLLALEMDLIVIGGVSRDNLRAQIEIWDRLIQELIPYLRTAIALPPDANNAATRTDSTIGGVAMAGQRPGAPAALPAG